MWFALTEKSLGKKERKKIKTEKTQRTLIKEVPEQAYAHAKAQLHTRSRGLGSSLLGYRLDE